MLFDLSGSLTYHQGTCRIWSVCGKPRYNQEKGSGDGQEVDLLLSKVVEGRPKPGNGGVNWGLVQCKPI